jgi:hypothetical protein
MGCIVLQAGYREVAEREVKLRADLAQSLALLPAYREHVEPVSGTVLQHNRVCTAHTVCTCNVPGCLWSWLDCVRPSHKPRHTLSMCGWCWPEATTKRSARSPCPAVLQRCSRAKYEVHLVSVRQYMRERLAQARGRAQAQQQTQRGTQAQALSDAEVDVYVTLENLQKQSTYIKSRLEAAQRDVGASREEVERQHRVLTGKVGREEWVLALPSQPRKAVLAGAEAHNHTTPGCQQPACHGMGGVALAV